MLHPDVFTMLERAESSWELAKDQVSKSAVAVFDAQEENLVIGEEIADMIRQVQEEKGWTEKEIGKKIIEPMLTQFADEVMIISHYPKTFELIPTNYDGWEDLAVGDNQAFLEFYQEEYNVFKPTQHILNTENVGIYFADTFGELDEVETDFAIRALMKIDKELRLEADTMVEYTSDVIALTNTPIDDLYIFVEGRIKEILAEG